MSATMVFYNKFLLSYYGFYYPITVRKPCEVDKCVSQLWICGMGQALQLVLPARAAHSVAHGSLLGTCRTVRLHKAGAAAGHTHRDVLEEDPANSCLLCWCALDQQRGIRHRIGIFCAGERSIGAFLQVAKMQLADRFPQTKTNGRTSQCL